MNIYIKQKMQNTEQNITRNVMSHLRGVNDKGKGHDGSLWVNAGDSQVQDCAEVCYRVGM